MLESRLALTGIWTVKPHWKVISSYGLFYVIWLYKLKIIINGSKLNRKPKYNIVYNIKLLFNEAEQL